jgi:hypothetical protein
MPVLKGCRLAGKTCGGLPLSIGVKGKFTIMIFIEATDLSSVPSCSVLLSIEQYKEYLTFQGPVYERYRQHVFGHTFLHFADEDARQRWLAACNRYNEASDELNYRDMYGQLNCSFQRRDEYEVIMQEAAEEMDACAVTEKRQDFYSWPKPALSVSQLQSLVDEAFERWQRYSDLFKSGSPDFELAEPALSERFREEPVIWRDPLPFTIYEYLSYELAIWLWASLRDYFPEWEKSKEQQDSPLFPRLFEHLKRLGFELAY